MAILVFFVKSINLFKFERWKFNQIIQVEDEQVVSSNKLNIMSFPGQYLGAWIFDTGPKMVFKRNVEEKLLRIFLYGTLEMTLYIIGKIIRVI